MCRSFAVLLFLTACDSDPAIIEDAAAPRDAPDAPACTAYLWEPGVGSLATWPSREMLVADPSTVTGRRFAITTEGFPEVQRFGSYTRLFTEDLSRVDGFGVNAAAFLRFGRAFDEARLPPTRYTPTPEDGLGFVVLPEDGAPELWPVRVAAIDEGATLQIIPNRPLPPSTRAAVFVSRALTPAGGGCLEPSDGMAAMLAAPDAELAAAIDALSSLGVVSDASELVALQPFVTQSIAEESLAVAAAIRAPTVEGVTCDAPAEGARHCVSTIEVGDFRDTDGVLSVDPADPAPTRSYALPLHAWLPTETEGPFPTVLFAHGLAGSAEGHGRLFARRAAEEGIATVAVSALAHPGHPTNPDDVMGLEATLAFFAADLITQTVEALRLRDHFQQSTFDRLAVASLLEEGPDLDGDDVADVDPERLAYVGLSLGAIMGPQLLALTDTFPVAVLLMPGGRVSALLSDPDGNFSTIRQALVPAQLRADEARLFTVFQTAIERGDAASWGPLVHRTRPPPSGEGPSLLVNMVVDDNIVTNPATYTLGRAMALEIVPPQLRDGHGLPRTAAPPLSGNRDGGSKTVGMFQFDRIEHPDGGNPIVATHVNLGTSEVSHAALFHFLWTHWRDGLAEVIDPYEALDLTRQ